MEKLEREKRALVKALEACKSHEKENKPLAEELENLVKKHEEDIKNMSEGEGNNVIFTHKPDETESQKTDKVADYANNKRDADKVIKDATINFYDDCKEAAVIGDTIGDPLKDTSGPSINILIKLSSIISVVFGGLFVKTNLFGKKAAATRTLPITKF